MVLDLVRRFAFPESFPLPPEEETQSFAILSERSVDQIAFPPFLDRLRVHAERA